jgi:hypothetical protein
MNFESIADHRISSDISSDNLKNNKKIRVGVMLDDYHLAAWHYIILDCIAKSEYSSVELVILNKGRNEKTPYPDKIPEEWKKLLYTTYTELENRLLQREPDAFARIDAQRLLQNVPALEIQPAMNTNSDWFEKEDIERIQEFRPDVIIKLGFRILKGDILDAARYGIWSYYPSDNTAVRGGPPGFWETFEGRGERGAILQVLTEDPDNGMVIYRSSYRCDSLFVSRNNNDCFLTSSMFVPRLLKKLHDGGRNAFISTIQQENNTLDFYDDVFYSSPTNSQFFRLFLQHYFHKGVQIIRDHFFHQQWFLMYDLQDHISTSLWRFKKIFPPRDRFWADPHVYFKDDTYYIFVEEYVFKKKRGHISVIEMQQSGKYSDPVMVLDEPFHLSYPHVFDHNGTVYMIPETYQAKSINLYQCTDFPTEWKHRATLMDSVKAVDSTLLFTGNKWWLFTNISEPEGTFNSNELFVFYSDDLISDAWNSHPMNPVISDIKRARSAGKIFEQNGILYRPSQCCVPTYGYGIKLNEIVTLTENDYVEKEISFIKPDWDKKLKGVHTLCHVNRLTMIDGYYNTFFL